MTAAAKTSDKTKATEYIVADIGLADFAQR